MAFLKLHDGWNFEICSDNQDGEAVVPFENGRCHFLDT